VVDSGDPSRPGLLVLDPAGAGRHGDPPASWQELDDAAHVTWLRLPAMEAAVATAREKLAELTVDGRRVHLLAAGEAAPLAELLALERPDALCSVLLVDPPAEPSGELVERGTTVVEQALLAHRTTPTGDVLAGHGVALHVVTYLDAERADRGAPLPLGHPDVVEAVRRTLAGEPPVPAEPPTRTEPPVPAKPPRTPTGEHTDTDSQTPRRGLLSRLWSRARRLVDRSAG
jgi:hypothetical protein